MKLNEVYNYYDILNVRFDASIDDIKTAFRRIVKNYHPDLVRKNDSEKLSLVMRAYEILSDEYKRNLYDYKCFGDRLSPKDNFLNLPKNRIKFSKNLFGLAKKGLLHKKFTKRDWNFHFHNDIDIFITPTESSMGCRAVFELPIRKLCPYCRGSDRRCYFCDGLGRIHSTQPIEVIIPKNVKDNSIIEVDLLKDCKLKFASFKVRKITIKINILGKKIETSNIK